MRKVEVARGFKADSVSSNVQEGKSKERFLAELDNEYPTKDGWEVIGAYNAGGISGNAIGILVFLVKYKYVPDE